MICRDNKREKGNFCFCINKHMLEFVEHTHGELWVIFANMWKKNVVFIPTMWGDRIKDKLS